MEDLADQVVAIVEDYRNDDGIEMSSNRILQWANQFEPGDRAFVLEETKNILSQRYVTKSTGLKFLKLGVEKLAESYNYRSPSAFLKNTVLLDLQEEGKSQKALLEMLDDVARNHWGVNSSEFSSHSQSNYLYIDDVLCTGNTLFLDIRDWLADGGNQRVEEGANVIFLYVFIHSLNFDKLRWRFRYDDDVNSGFKYKILYMHQVENDYREVESDLDLVFPLRQNQPQAVFDYLDSIDSLSDQSVFRASGKPKEEKLFSSPENRIRYENILLSEGLSILDSVSVQKENVRPLGYTLPSHKTLGFGTLSFTWRNVPNNTPLIFWYSAPDWQPLFENKRPDPPLSSGPLNLADFL
jgi:hypothetical protein